MLELAHMLASATASATPVTYSQHLYMILASGIISSMVVKSALAMFISFPFKAILLSQAVFY